MSLLSVVLQAFQGKGHFDLVASPAKGEAHTAIRALITELGKMAPSEIRSESTPDYFEAVIRRERLEEYSDLVAEVFGEPCKPFDERVKFVPHLARRIKTMGGIAKNQCLYIREFEDRFIAAAAFWPWMDGESVTLKVKVFEEPAAKPEDR